MTCKTTPPLGRRRFLLGGVASAGLLTLPGGASVVC